MLQANYKYYIRVVGLLIEPRYNDLWKVDYRDDKSREKILNLLFELSEKLRRTMKENNRYIDSKYGDNEPSETLITKIIMATMGCVPAYDTYFKEGLKRFLKTSSEGSGIAFRRSAFERLLKFTRENDTLKGIYGIEMRTVSGVAYPPMKLLDYQFWKAGGGSGTSS